MKRPVTLAGLLIIILAGCYLVVNTTMGLRLLLGAFPGKITTEAVAGTLYRGFSLERLAYSGNSYKLDIDKVSLTWQPLDLLRNRLQIDEVNIDGLAIVMTGGLASSADRANFSLNLPVTVSLSSLNVSDVMVTGTNGEPLLQAARLSVRAHTEEQILVLDDITVSSPDYQAALSGQISLAGTAEHRLSVDWLFKVTDSLAIDGNTDITGTIASTNITTVVTAPLQAGIDLTLQRSAGNLSWNGTASTADLDPASYNGNFPGQVFTLGLSATGTVNTAHIEGDLRLADNAGPVITPAGDDPAAYIFRNFGTKFILDITGLRGGRPELIGNTSWESIDLISASSGKSVLFHNGRLDLNYHDGQFQFQSRSAFTYDNGTDGDWRISGTGNAELIEMDTISLNFAEGTINGGLIIDRSTPETVFNGNASWERFSFPGLSSQLLALSRGTVAISGSREDYLLKLNTDISVDDKAPVNLAVTATGNLEKTTINPVVLTGFNGEITGMGSVDWLNGPQAGLQLTGRDLDPGMVWNDWPGKLNLDAGINAIKQDDGFAVNIDDIKLSGLLRQLPVQLVLSSSYRPGSLEIRNAKLTSATSSIELDGTWGSQTGIDWKIHSPDLNMLHPDMTGQLSAQGRVSGTIEHPVIAAVLNASAVNSPWIGVGHADASLNLHSVTGTNIDIDLNMQGLSRQSTRFDDFSLSVSGDTTNHDYTIKVVSNARQLIAAGQGSYTTPQWQGSINNLEVIPDNSGDKWATAGPSGVTIQKDTLKIEQLCVHNDPAAVCGQLTWIAADGWDGSLRANALPVDLMNDYMPEFVKLAGQANVEFYIAKTAGSPVVANGNINVTSGEIRMRVNDKQFQSIPVQGFDGQFELADGVLNSNLLVIASDSFIEPLNAHFKLTGLESMQPDYAYVGLEGGVNWKLNDLSILSIVVPQITDIQGDLDVDLTITGTVTSPQVQGKLLLGHSGFIIPELGIELENLELRGNSVIDGSYTLEGKASSGGGELLLSAGIDGGSANGFAVTTVLSGERFEIINSPEIRALASPEVKIIITNKTTDVKGTIGISDARINLGEFREIVPLSDDVIFKDRIVQPRRDTRIDTAIQINFGERISIQGQGLTGKLTGTLDVYSNDKGDLLGKGEVAIIEGKFSAYGQSLLIQEGKLIFQGNRLDNPEIRITALRRIDETITAGIKISGYLSNPLVTLFSTPAMSEDEILAYIVFGRPISSLTSGEGSDLIGAATAMGLQNTGFLTRSLSSTFGLDSLQFTSDSSGANASLVIGKYITPKLYLSYVMGVFERIATASIRYDLNENWSVEVKSSTDVGVDIYYDIQK